MYNSDEHPVYFFCRLVLYTMKGCSIHFCAAYLGKMVFRPHLQHSAPLAGQCCCLVCQLPHRSQGSLFASSFWMASMPICSELAPLALRDFICADVSLLVLHISIALCNVRSGSLSSLLRVLSHMMPQTILSLVRPSLRSLNSHDCALVLRSVRY